MMKRLLILGILFICLVQIAWGRDPTQPVNYDGSAGEQGVSVTYILVSPQRTFAIVNGQNVQVGDSISGVKVVDIQPDFVQFEHADGKFKILLHAHTIKQKIENKD